MIVERETYESDIPRQDSRLALDWRRNMTSLFSSAGLMQMLLKPSGYYSGPLHFMKWPTAIRRNQWETIRQSLRAGSPQAP